jgi:hypothetical protein
MERAQRTLVSNSIRKLTLDQGNALVVLEVNSLSDAPDWSVHEIPPPDGFRNPNPLDLTLDVCMLSGEGLERLFSTCTP